MSRTFGLSLLAMSVAFAVTLTAEKPPKEFQDIMKSNGSIIDISLGMVRSVGGPGVGEENRTTSLRAHIRAKDYDGIASDAATLKVNFTKVEAFWTDRKVDDAIKFSKAAVKAATDLAAAARAKDDTAISASANTVAATCRDCHQTHRVIRLVDGTFEIQ